MFDINPLAARLYLEDLERRVVPALRPVSAGRPARPAAVRWVLWRLRELLVRRDAVEA